MRACTPTNNFHLDARKRQQWHWKKKTNSFKWPSLCFGRRSMSERPLDRIAAPRELCGQKGPLPARKSNRLQRCLFFLLSALGAVSQVDPCILLAFYININININIYSLIAPFLVVALWPSAGQSSGPRSWAAGRSFKSRSSLCGCTKSCGPIFFVLQSNLTEITFFFLAVCVWGGGRKWVLIRQQESSPPSGNCPVLPVELE